MAILALTILTEGWVRTLAVEGRSSRPTEALRRSARHGLTIALSGGLGAGLAVGLPVGLALGLPFGLPVGLAFGLSSGLSSGLAGGLAAPVGHAATRLTMAVRRLLPIRLVAFLDKAAASGIMYPAGPGYRFRHRILADHLASHTSLPIGVDLTEA